MIEDPFGGRPVVACRALRTDVALIHAHRADRYGNVQMEPTAMWLDIAIMPKAARKVVVSDEEIADSDVLRSNPDKTLQPGFIIDAVVEIPPGGHPTSFYPDYGYDSQFHKEWVSVSRDDEAALHSCSVTCAHRGIRTNICKPLVGDRPKNASGPGRNPSER